MVENGPREPFAPIKLHLLHKFSSSVVSDAALKYLSKERTQCPTKGAVDRQLEKETITERQQLIELTRLYPQHGKIRAGTCAAPEMQPKLTGCQII